MKPLLSVGIAILCLGLGIVIGKTSLSSKNDEKEGLTKKDQEVSQSRSSKRGDTRYSDRRRVGKIGGTPPEKYENKVLHLLALVENGLDFHNVDALLELRALMKGMSTLELSQALTDMEDIEVGRGRYDAYSILVSQLAKKDGIAALTYVMEQKGRINLSLIHI